MLWCVIPFRKGSKRMQHKNLRDLHGKPLVWWTVAQALDVFKGENIILTTDIDLDMLTFFIPEASTNSIRIHEREKVSDTQEAKEYLLQVINSHPIGTDDSIVLLQPTCPCRESDDIREAIDTYERMCLPNLVSVQEFTDYTRMYSGRGYDSAALLSRHGIFESDEKLYVRNSSIYIFSVSYLLNLKDRSIFSAKPAIYVMPKYKSIDINTPMDFAQAEWVYKNKRGKEVLKSRPLYLK
jgi:CMP-N,N'-diacetyllegionaminic acid synthase